MKTAIFGGTFDPIHRAHLVVAREAADTFSLDRVLFIPAANPPHKEAGASYEDRYKMVELACACEPRFIPSRLDKHDLACESATGCGAGVFYHRL
jgi:nicotinate-nucleotide adenylyltransferase